MEARVRARLAELGDRARDPDEVLAAARQIVESEMRLMNAPPSLVRAISEALGGANKGSELLQLVLNPLVRR